jgi:hypothetical protein
MGLVSSIDDVSFWWYVAPLTVLVVVLLTFLIKRQKREQALASMVRRLKQRHEATKEDAAAVEELGGHHQLLLVNEALFAVGLTLLLISYLKQSWVVFSIGLVVMLITLYVLQIVLSHPGREPSHHLLALFEKTGIREEEAEIVRDVNALIHKEKLLEMKENEVKRQLEALYHMATTLDAKDDLLRRQEKKIMKPVVVESDVKKVLNIMDDVLEKLPEREIDRFVSSPQYKVYKKVMERMK